MRLYLINQNLNKRLNLPKKYKKFKILIQKIKNYHNQVQKSKDKKIINVDHHYSFYIL